MKKRVILPALTVFFLVSIQGQNRIIPANNKINSGSVSIDLGVDNIFTGKHNFCNIFSRELITVVRNYGTEPVTDFNVKIFRNGNHVKTISNTEILNPGEYIDLFDWTFFSVSGSDSTYILACIDMPDDQNPANDCYERVYPMFADSSLCHPYYTNGVYLGGFLDYIVLNGKYLQLPPPNPNENWWEFYGFYGSVYWNLGIVNELKLFALTDDVYFSGWIDFNRDNILTEDEKVLDCEYMQFGYQEYSFQFYVPFQCNTDLITKMRLRTNVANCANDPCDTLFSGMTLDFNVNEIGWACGYDAAVDSIIVPSATIESSEITPTAIVSNPNCGNSNVFGADARITKNNELVYYSCKDEILLCGDSSEVIQFDPWVADTGVYICIICSHSADDNYPEDNCEQIDFEVVHDKIMDIMVFLEGPYNGTDMNTTLLISGLIPFNQPYNTAPWNYSGTEFVPSMPNSAIVDWILVELRDAPDASSAWSSTMVAQQAAFLLKDGSVAGTDGLSLLRFSNISVQNSLFAVIRHRNSIGIITANSLNRTNGIYSYNFTSDANVVYGGNIAHKELAPGAWGLTGADGNADGQINNPDKINIWLQQSGQNGYLPGDFNLDAQVNNTDKNELWKPNTGLGGQVPQ
ncbi:MAG: hypothetical protein JXA03_04985 [Bacteroidales bacterium]|nr:hypothetical protein [Bacteroidales bacterium]